MAHLLADNVDGIVPNQIQFDGKDNELVLLIPLLLINNVTVSISPDAGKLL